MAYGLWLARFRFWCRARASALAAPSSRTRTRSRYVQSDIVDHQPYAPVSSVMARDAIDRRVHRLAGDAGLIDVAVTVHTPPHRQRLDLAHALHRLDRTVTLLAPHGGRDVRTMIEVHEI